MIALSTCGTPWPRASLAQTVTRIELSRAPAMGIAGRSQSGMEPRAASDSCSTRWSNSANPIAPNAVIVPITAPTMMRYQSRSNPRRRLSRFNEL